MPRSIFVLVLVGIITAMFGCRSGAKKVADLAEVRGVAERDHATAVGRWDPASVGASFAIGDAVRTKVESGALVRLVRGGGLRMGANSLVRFRMGLRGSQRPRVLLETGEAEIETASESVEFETSIGTARIEPGGRVRINADQDRIRFNVVVGQAVMEAADGGVAQAAGPGETITIEMGKAEVEPTAVTSASASASAQPATEAAQKAIQADVQGDGVQLQSGSASGWTPLAAGRSELASGARVRLPDGASMMVQRGDEQASVRGAAEVVVGAPGGALLSAIGGRVTVDGSKGVVRVDVPGGSILARTGQGGTGRATISIREGGETDVKSEKGEVEVRGNRSATVLAAGESTTLGKTGDLDTDIMSPSHADISISAGESPVIHDPAALTAVRIMFDAVCSGDGVVELAGAAGKGRRAKVRVRGHGGAVVLARAGGLPYQVKCIEGDGVSDAVRASGVVRVVKDTGAADLPREAPRNTIDADGRNYTVMYQNLLPHITFTWSKAPKSSSSFVLHVDRDGGAARTVKTGNPVYGFSSGQLAEGSYRCWFQDDSDATKRSPVTTLKIDFDNAAPTAQIQAQSGGAEGQGTSVMGVAIEGATVSVNGAPVQLDPQHRFRIDAAPQQGESALPIKISHPRLGVHYYVRRMGKGGP